jgi:hypothetical protein
MTAPRILSDEERAEIISSISQWVGHDYIDDTSRRLLETAMDLIGQLTQEVDIQKRTNAQLRLEAGALEDENKRLRLEFRADCEKQAGELFALVRENEALYQTVKRMARLLRPISSDDELELATVALNNLLDLGGANEKSEYAFVVGIIGELISRYEK